MNTPPFDDRDGQIWLDGALVPWREAKLHVLSHGLHYASSVFEGERVYGGRVFKLREHTERLLHSARLLGFEIPHTAETIDAATEAVLRANGIAEGYVRPVAWRGPEQLSIAAPASSVRLAIAAWPLATYFAEGAAARGLRLTVADWRRPPPACAPVHAKAAGLYMICTLAKHAALAQGFDDALMLDWRGCVAEATAANVFFVFGEELHTPVADCFLDGITRRTVLALAQALGIKTVERLIPAADMARASEAFVTGTAAEIAPIGRIGETHYAGRELTQRLQRAYAAAVRAP